MHSLGFLILAFAMFSRLPMPRLEWTEENSRYLLAGFPLVGLVQGALACGWGWLAKLLTLPDLLTAVGFTLLPLVFNGGIHLDGLADTADALASRAERPRKLEILKDPHIGAFGVLALVSHLLLLVALFAALPITAANLYSLPLLYALSRSWSAVSVLHFPPAKPDGLARGFAERSAVRAVTLLLGCYILVLTLGLVLLQGWLGLLISLGAVLTLLYYRRLALRQFGGVSGDLAGWFLQTAELVMLATLVLGGWWR